MSVKNWISLKVRNPISKSNTCTIQTVTRSYTPEEFDSTAKRFKKAEHIFAIIYPSGFLPEYRFRKCCRCWSVCITRLGNFYSVKELCETLGNHINEKHLVVSNA